VLDLCGRDRDGYQQHNQRSLQFGREEDSKSLFSEVVNQELEGLSQRLRDAVLSLLHQQVFPRHREQLAVAQVVCRDLEQLVVLVPHEQPS